MRYPTGTEVPGSFGLCSAPAFLLHRLHNIGEHGLLKRKLKCFLAIHKNLFHGLFVMNTHDALLVYWIVVGCKDARRLYGAVDLKQADLAGWPGQFTGAIATTG